MKTDSTKINQNSSNNYYGIINPYNRSIELKMINLYQAFSEKSRRLYAAVEALKFKFGGISYIANLLVLQW